MHSEQTIGIERFIESLGDAALLLTPDGSIVAANELAEDLYCAYGGKLLGRPFTSLCDNVDHPAVAHALHDLNGTANRFSARAHRLDGSTFAGAFSARLQHARGTSEEERVLLLVREIEFHLSTQSEDLELHQLMLEHSLDGIISHTVDGRLLFANRAAQQQWGISFEEACARGPWGWTAAETRGGIPHRMSQLMERGEARFESHSVAPGGRMRHQEIHARVVHTSTGVVVVSTVRDISERMQAEELVRYLAYHDTLTGLANRPMLTQELTHQMSVAQLHGDLLGVVYLDLDSFKPVNDTHGHATGDNVLRVVADRISSCVREYDTVARLGGDEFVVVVPRISDPSNLESVAEKLSAEIARPIWIGAQEVCVTASTGIALYQPGDDVDSLLTRADFNMYGERGTDIREWGL